MKHTMNEKTLESNALRAHTVLLKQQQPGVDWMLDRHFIREHVVPLLYFRLQSYLPLSALELAELWAEHLGLSETLKSRAKVRMEPLFKRYLELLAAEMDTQTVRPLHRLLGKAV